jgi:hypothetical protein
MKKAIVLLIILVFASLAKAGISDPKGVFKEANKQYESSNYEQALTYYQTLVDEKIESSELYFNLGNTYYKLSNFPKAILFYEKANKLSPNDKYTLNGLELARTKITDRQERTRIGFSAWVSTFFGFTVDFWAWMSILSLLFSLVAFVFYKRIEKTLFKSTAKIKMYVFGVLFILFVVVSFIKYNVEVNSNLAIVMEPSVTLKTEPNKISENTFVLHEGSKIVVLREENEWSEIRFGANEGWIENSNIEKI